MSKDGTVRQLSAQERLVAELLYRINILEQHVATTFSYFDTRLAAVEGRTFSAHRRVAGLESVVYADEEEAFNNPAHGVTGRLFMDAAQNLEQRRPDPGPRGESSNAV